MQGSERQRAASAPEPRGQPLAIGCRPGPGSLPRGLVGAVPGETNSVCFPACSPVGGGFSVPGEPSCLGPAAGRQSQSRSAAFAAGGAGESRREGPMSARGRCCGAVRSRGEPSGRGERTRSPRRFSKTRQVFASRSLGVRRSRSGIRRTPPRVLRKNATIFAAVRAGGNRGVCYGSWGRDCRRPPGACIFGHTYAAVTWGL